MRFSTLQMQCIKIPGAVKRRVKASIANTIPVLDKPRGLRQALGVENPPNLNQPADSAKPRRGRGKYIVIVILLLVVGAGLFAAFHKKDPAITVQTEKVSRHDITETVTANGKIYPVLQVKISAEVSGELIELPVKEGQFVHKGDLLLKINPKTPLAYLNQSKASYASSLASISTSAANLEKAEADFKRNKELFDRKLISDSDYISFKVARDIALAQVESTKHQVELAKAAVDSAQDSLDKTTISAPLDGTITKLTSQLGERVLGTVQNAGTEIMTISDLSAMEARVDIGEMDIVLLQPGQKAKLEVDSFKDVKFAGVVSAVANSSKDLNAASASGSSSSSSGQTATQFQVRILLAEGDKFRPGMSVSAVIETRTHTNVISAPIASVTTRVPKPKTDAASGVTNSPATNAMAATGSDTNSLNANRTKPVEVVFVVEGDHVNAVPVKIGISDDNYWEITDGLKEGDEIVTGGFKAIGRELEDGKKITKGSGGKEVNSK
jgi:HlyD family secretion protein